MAQNREPMWEVVGFGSNTSTIISRTPIFGGWLVTSSTEHPAEPNSVSITFVPDHEHKWDLKTDYSPKEPRMYL